MPVDPALRDRLQELQLYLENAVDQLQRAQRLLLGSEAQGRERDDDPMLAEVNQALTYVIQLRNQARDRLMKALSGTLKVLR